MLFRLRFAEPEVEMNSRPRRLVVSLNSIRAAIREPWASRVRAVAVPL